MNHNVEAFKKYYVNATKEEVIEDMFKDICYKQNTIDKALQYIEDTCYYPELENYSNMTDNEVKELLKILKGDETNE